MDISSSRCVVQEIESISGSVYQEVADRCGVEDIPDALNAQWSENDLSLALSIVYIAIVEGIEKERPKTEQSSKPGLCPV